MKTAICTISTKSHLFKSQATLESAGIFSNVELFCLVTDSNEFNRSGGIHYSQLSDLKSDTSNKLIYKYKGDQLRWALKPVYTKHLLENGYDSVIYVDNDIFFFASPDFLFEKLKSVSFLLTPHFYRATPHKDQNWLEANYRVGLYNAGFFGANKDAAPILDWWAECCLYNVKKAYWRGLYDDQKYLDLIPVLYNKVEIVKHRGWNFAGWNCDEVELKVTTENQLLINDDPLVFVHFAQLSIERFSDPKSVVFPFYSQYLTALQKYSPGFNFTSKKLKMSSFSAYFYYLRWKFSRLFEH